MVIDCHASETFGRSFQLLGDPKILELKC
jgi:hypothetical protein